MEKGLLWFDDSAAELADKVKVAAKYYRQKYGRQPNLCYGNPSQVTTSLMVNGVKVLPRKTVLPYNLWIGEGKDETLDD